MKDSKQKPKPSGKDRVAVDKKIFERLTRETKKRLVEGNSPAIYDYVNYELETVSHNLDYANNSISNSFKADATLGDSYLTCADRDILASVDLWSKEYQQVLHDAEMRSYGYLYDQEDKGNEFLECAGRDIDNGISDQNTAIIDDIDEGKEEIIVRLDDDKKRVKDDLDDAEINGGGVDFGWMDALGTIPAIIVHIGNLLDQFINLDEDKFIEDNIALTKATKRLQARLAEEEM